jgi:hypothetical protein
VSICETYNGKNVDNFPNFQRINARYSSWFTFLLTMLSIKTIWFMIMIHVRKHSKRVWNLVIIIIATSAAGEKRRIPGKYIWNMLRYIHIYTHVHKHRKALNIYSIQYAAGVFLNIIHTGAFTGTCGKVLSHIQRHVLHWRNLAEHMYINFCIHTVGIMLYIKIHLYTH